MICTVSTIMDSIHNVRAFVEENLAGGADHLFIFLEGGDREVLAFLGDHPHVTVVDSDTAALGTPMPEKLTERQIINANRANLLLSDLDRVQWLFHIDGDERLDIDRDRLLALGPEVAAVQLLPRESVNSSSSEALGLYKRLLTPRELALLTALGIIAAPHNYEYFRGHVRGKPGMRPTVRHGIGLHRARVIGEKDHIEGFRAEWLHVLHHESVTLEEFVRKWSVHVASGAAAFRPTKQIVGAAAEAVMGNDHLDEHQKRRFLTEIYRQRIEDDVATLTELGMLEPAVSRSHRPTSFTAGERDRIEQVLPHLLEAHVSYFAPTRTRFDPAELMSRIRVLLG